MFYCICRCDVFADDSNQSLSFSCIGQAERLPDIREADKLARAILLCVDMERRELKKDAREALRSLLSPLLDTLSRVYTNIYLPVHKSDKSLQLMLRLLQLSTRPHCQQQGLEGLH